MRIAKRPRKGTITRIAFGITATVILGAISLSTPSAFRFNIGSAAGPQEESKKREARYKEERMVVKMRELKEREMSPEERDERRRVELEQWLKATSEIAKATKLSMEQALQVAAGQQPGLPVECRLVRERDETVYSIVVFSGNDPETALTRIQVSARDGKVVAFERIR
ncbi:MAG TPA: PepSY domain-containing protein [Blastocatellia bacterium]|nr:PepSY domain-containing protein [Blastocatellia bacterium]